MNGELPTLKACPFCRGLNLKALTHTVVCLECDATGPMPKTALSVRPAMHQVVAAWNARALEDELDERAELLEKVRTLMRQVLDLMMRDHDGE